MADARDAAGPGHRANRWAIAAGAGPAAYDRRPGGVRKAPPDGRRVRPDVLRPEVGVGGVGAGRRRPPGRGSTPRTRRRCSPSSRTRRRRCSRPGPATPARSAKTSAGIVAAAFDHWDSRAGDPQLHTHVVVLNRVQAVERRQVADPGLQGPVPGHRGLVGAVQRDPGRLAHRGPGVGVGAEGAAPVGGAEVGDRRGPGAAAREFSQRSAAIETVKDDLVEEFVAAHGRQPTAREVHPAAAAGDPGHPPGQARQTRWRSWSPGGGPGPPTTSPGRHRGWAAGLAGRNREPVHTVEDDHRRTDARDVAGLALGEVADKRATFTRANVFAEASGSCTGSGSPPPPTGSPSPNGPPPRRWPARSCLTPPTGHVPEELLRADGTSRLVPATPRSTPPSRSWTPKRGSWTPADASTARRRPGRRCHHSPRGPARARTTRCPPSRPTPSASVVTSPRRLDVLVGAAGTGKSTTMAGVRAAWEAQYGRGSVVGLAPSAAAAEVLADAVGVPTENTAKWLTEQTRAARTTGPAAPYCARLLDRATPPWPPGSATAAGPGPGRARSAGGPCSPGSW